MKKILTLIAVITVANSAYAASGFQAALTPDIAIVDRGATVKGVALNIWGENQVNGLDLGFVNGLNGQSTGLSWSFLGSYAEDYKGVLLGGFFVRSTGEVTGWQDGAINISTGNIHGLQSGLVNIAKDVKGVQLGFLNYTEQLQGVQIGLLNVVTQNEWFTELPEDLAKGFPFVNWSF